MYDASDSINMASTVYIPAEWQFILQRLVTSEEESLMIITLRWGTVIRFLQIILNLAPRD